LRYEPAFERFVVIPAPRRYDLRAEHMKGLWVELTLPIHHGPQNRHAPHIAIVENFNDRGTLVTKAEVSLVENQSSSERVQRVEERRNSGSSAGKEPFVTE